MQELVKIWCDNHPTVVEYSIPNINTLIKKSDLKSWELVSKDKEDFENWIPIYTNCTGVNYTTYYYNLNKKSPDHGKILGLWAHCCSDDTEIKIVAETIDEFLAIPKYASMIRRKDDFDGVFKVSLLSDFEL